MDGVIDDLIRAARRCDRAHKAIISGQIDDLISRLNDACDDVGLSWSGSNIGNHATIYLENFRAAKPGEIFDREWGCEGGYSSRTRGNWGFTNYDQVKAEIIRRSGVSDLAPLIEAAYAAGESFKETKEEILPIFDAYLSNGEEDKVIIESREDLYNLRSHYGTEEIALATLPKGGYMSRDSLAMSEGQRVSHHIVFKSFIQEQFSYGVQVAEVAKIARHVARYMGHKLQMKGV